MRRTVLVTSGVSLVVGALADAPQVRLAGILDCVADPALKQFALSRDIPYRELKNQNDKLIRWITSLHPEVLAVFRMPWLLRREIFSIPPFGAINVHPSLLPMYRGLNPWEDMLHDGVTEGGVTIHCIDDGADTGDILCQRRFTIRPGMTLSEARALSEQLAADMLPVVLQKLDILHRIPQSF